MSKKTKSKQKPPAPAPEKKKAGTAAPALPVQENEAIPAGPAPPVPTPKKKPERAFVLGGPMHPRMDRIKAQMERAKAERERRKTATVPAPTAEPIDPSEVNAALNTFFSTLLSRHIVPMFYDFCRTGKAPTDARLQQAFANALGMPISEFVQKTEEFVQKISKE